jgi:hypothetical protein
MNCHKNCEVTSTVKYIATYVNYLETEEFHMRKESIYIYKVN